MKIFLSAVGVLAIWFTGALAIHFVRQAGGGAIPVVAVVSPFLFLWWKLFSSKEGALGTLLVVIFLLLVTLALIITEAA